MHFLAWENFTGGMIDEMDRSIWIVPDRIFNSHGYFA